MRVDEELLNAVEKWAADEFRSSNGQLEWIIAKALKDAGRLRKKKIETGNKDTENNNF